MGWIILDSSRRGTLPIGVPHSDMEPLVCGNRPSRIFASVVLPQPDSPTSARTSPRVTVRSTPFTA